MYCHRLAVSTDLLYQLTDTAQRAHMRGSVVRVRYTLLHAECQLAAQPITGSVSTVRIYIIYHHNAGTNLQKYCDKWRATLN